MKPADAKATLRAAHDRARMLPVAGMRTEPQQRGAVQFRAYMSPRCANRVLWEIRREGIWHGITSRGLLAAMVSDPTYNDEVKS